MEILNSDWLINMLKKSSKTPQGRLLGLFDILGDWLNAPNITKKTSGDLAQQQTPQIISSALEHYLTQQATLAGAEDPDVLAHQLYFILLTAIHTAIHTHDMHSFGHARSAAKALITAQTKQEFHLKKSVAYVAAASFLGIVVIAGSTFISSGFNFNHISNSQLATTSATKIIALNSAAAHQSISTSPTIASPEQTAALFATLEQMRKGSCQFPEALQLPDSYKAVYIDNIIGGNISSKVADQKIILQILQKVRCNYTPMLMENSTS